MQNSQNLIWIDLEMTGLNPDTDVIIEMATIVTDSNLNTLADGPVIAHPPQRRRPRHHGRVEHPHPRQPPA